VKKRTKKIERKRKLHSSSDAQNIKNLKNNNGDKKSASEGDVIRLEREKRDFSNTINFLALNQSRQKT
jgi:hypothetical protein